MAAFLRRARVVALPVDLGTGTPNKLFEAFEAGAAVVASAGVIARASSPGARAPARAAVTDEEFAREITAYLTDPERAARDGAACRAFAEAHADRRASVAALATAYRAAVEGA
jgi:glycosyltransferase involved in cell wall biosynthesis